MHAYLKETKQATYYCEMCDTRYDVGDYEAGRAVYLGSDGLGSILENEVRFVGDHDGSGDEHCSYVYAETDQRIIINLGEHGSVENVWWCGGGCFHHDEGAKPDVDREGGEIWVCDECEEEYEDKTDAMSCCT